MPTDEHNRRLAAALRYIDDPHTSPFTLEGLGHMNVFLDDIMRRAKMASIISSKGLTQESVGEEAAFDFYYRGQNTLQMAIRAKSLGSLIETLLEQNADGISLEDLKVIYVEVLLKTSEKHKDLSDFGSSITHLMQKALKEKGQP